MRFIKADGLPKHLHQEKAKYETGEKKNSHRSESII
jgi:hypothetical protein